MKIKKDIFKKIASLFLVFSFVFNPLITGFVLADDASGSADTTVPVPAPVPVPVPAEIVNTNTNNQNSTENATPSGETDSTPTSSPATPSGDISTENINQAVVSQNTTVSADTGNNQVVASGNAQIDTGTATAAADVVNVVNTNILNSNYQFSTADITGSASANIDFYNDWLKLLTSDPSTQSGSLDLNSAVLESDASVSANSGGNNIISSGSAAINTGDATAVANVFNLVNTNIVNSHFLMGVVDVFGDYSGNIILPSQEDFVANLFQSVGGSNTNIAQISSQTISDANTGNNSAETVQTGDAVSQANSFNFINTNYSGGGSIFLIVNSFGAFPQIFSYGSDFSATESALIANINKALVESDVTATANTGNNTVSASGSSTVNTGNAKSLANQVNFVNTNITGSNWFFGLVNIFGNFSGKVVYGYPKIVADSNDDTNTNNTGNSQNSSDPSDPSNGSSSMTLESSDNVNEFVYPGDTVTFEVKVKNTGNTTINNVVLSQALHDGEVVNVGNAVLSVGTLDPGKTADVTYGVRLPESSEAGLYTSEISVSGNSSTGNVSAGSAINSFIVKILGGNFIPIVQAVDNNNSQPESGTVLGSHVNTTTHPKTDYRYLGLIILPAIWLIIRRFRPIFIKK